MKRILLVCLLGMGLLLPAINNTAKGFFIHRVLDVFIEDHNLQVSAESDDGALVHINIRKTSNNDLVLSQDLSGYYASVDISGLAAGTYSAKVFSTTKNYTEVFAL